MIFDPLPDVLITLVLFCSTKIRFFCCVSAFFALKINELHKFMFKIHKMIGKSVNFEFLRKDGKGGHRPGWVLVTCLFTVLYMVCVKVTRSAWVGEDGGRCETLCNKAKCFCSFHEKMGNRHNSFCNFSENYVVFSYFLHLLVECFSIYGRKIAYCLAMCFFVCIFAAR